MSRSYLCTYHLTEESTDEAVEVWRDILKNFHELLQARYTVGQLEKGEETGALHIQFYINFKNTVKTNRFKKVNPKIHFEKCKSEEASMDYVQKEETRVDGPQEYGEKPFHANRKVDWDAVWEKAKQGKVDEIQASVRFIHYNKIKAIAKDYMKFEDKDHLRGIWIWGKPGTGKSRWARDQAKKLNTPLYPKMCNKWWDGYQGEKLVCMDDIGPNHECLAQQLKIWTDRYDCILKNKGGACHSQYEWFIVTSQYPMEKIFKDEEDLAALQRRFQVYNINDINNFNLTLNN